jgi:hypothetical protein
MSLFPITHITPIILPESLFIDRFNNQNLYSDINPSIYISDNGSVKILVRRVNYRKFHNKNFILYEDKSKSVYAILTGAVSAYSPLNTENFNYDTIKNIYSIPTYWTYWIGLEDIRFITDYSILVTIPECNISGQPCIFRASLDNNTIHSHSICSPNTIEKNWMPYIDHQNNHKVIYSLFPFIIKSIDADDRKIIPISDTTLEDYHGSTNGIEYNGKRLFLVHHNKERTYHRWILFNTITNSLKISKPFVFFKHAHIEFTCSLASFKERIFVSIGVNDDRAFILELNKNDIDESFVL